MNLPFFRFTFFLLMSLTLPLTATAQVVDIPDPNLRAAIENKLGKAPGTPIAPAEMVTLTHLEARNANISDLTGLEGATNLKSLRLGGNSISDIAPVEALTNLTELNLSGNLISDISPVADLNQLTWLHLQSNRISDIAALASLTNLTALRLDRNSISDISVLSRLIQLTELRLDRNSLTDLSPLVANTGLRNGDTVGVRENPLSSTSIKTHIPILQSRGVTIKFDDVTHLNFSEPRTVRMIYFLPSDRSPRQNIDTKLDTLIRDVQQFYADEMERHGFKGKTFTFETDATGKAVVHHVDGQFTDSYYRQNTFRKVWEEIREQFYTPQNIYLIAIDIGNERVGRGYNEVCGVGDSHEASGGHVLIPASGDCFNFKTTAHELGHAFGLQHDFRNDTYIMSFGKVPNKLSECTAGWLDAHRYFNMGQSPTHFDNPTTIQMLTPFASPPYAIGLRFEVTDPDGVHQAQLLTPATIRRQELGQSKLLNCKRLNGETDTIEIEFVTSQLTVNSEDIRDGGVSEAVPLSVEVILRVIDVYGNVTLQTYPIDITTTLLTGTVSTPYTNQAINISEPVPPSFTVRQAFELDPFYQQWIDVEGLPVVASEKVNPYALKEAAWLIWQMIGHRPEILHVLVQKRVRFVVIGHTEITTDIPEYSDQGPDFLVYRFRGLGGGGLSGHIAVSSSEENLLHYPGGGSHSIMIHEVAHAIHRFGLNTVDPTFNNRLQIAYDAAMEKGLWQGTYASSDRGEYWAEGTQAWFYPKGGDSFYNYGNTRQALKEYDPGLAALLAEVYGDSGWRYTSPAARIHLPHLQGFNPQDSPTFQGWPELEAVYQQLRNPNSDGGGRWVDLRPYDPSLLPSLSESRTAGPRTTVAFVNLTRSYVLVYPVGYDGTPELWTQLPPGFVRVTPGTTNEIWLIKDLNGRNLAVFQAVEKTGRILIDETLNLITPGLSKISGDNQTSVSGAALSNPFVIEVRDENGSALEGISITFTVTVGNGTLSVTRTTTDKNGAAQSTLTLGPNIGTQTVSVSAAGIEGMVTFTAMVEAAVDLPDLNLRAAIETVLGKAKGDSITPSEMATLPHLEARDANISDLTGLEGATNLTYLDFWKSSVSDLSPVAGLTNLTHLGFAANNAISDVSALAGLTNLTALWVNGNSISDISPLVGLTKLSRLGLDNNNISDISALAGLTNLSLLNLRSNSILDISPLANLTKLTKLRLGGNSISDISAVAGLTQLESLSLWANSISNSLPVEGLTNLTELNLSGNSISSIVSVAGLTQMTWLHLQSNRISDISALAGLTNLTALRLDRNSISDISALSSLIHLTELRLDRNSITDLSPLVVNTGLGSGDEVDVRGNPLSYQSIHTHIPILQSRGVTVEFDNQAHPALLKIAGDNQKGASFAPLPNLLVAEVQDAKGSALAGVSVTFAVTAGGGTLSTTITRTDENGRAQSTLTLGPNLGTNTVKVSAVGIEVSVTFYAISDTESPPITADVNNDGSVNILDLILIASDLGNTGTNLAADVNGDGVISILDLVLAAGMFEEAAAAPAAHAQAPKTLTAVEVQQWLADARSLEARDVIVNRGFLVLEQLLVSPTPRETELLANYPNPFNPETWIPYRLAEDAVVTLTIYDLSGRLVRTLEVGHRIASVYENRSKAIYWDGRNEVGEQVASGVYFYNLSTGNYSATRKMLVVK